MNLKERTVLRYGLDVAHVPWYQLAIFDLLNEGTDLGPREDVIMSAIAAIVPTCCHSWTDLLFRSYFLLGGSQSKTFLSVL